MSLFSVSLLDRLSDDAWTLYPIGATNLLLGWTVLGWCIALIWSLTGNTRQRVADGSWQ